MGRLLKMREVMALIGRPEVWIYRQEKAGRFPLRVQIGPNSVAWYENEIQKWLESLPRGPKPSPVLADAARAARDGERKKHEARA